LPDLIERFDANLLIADAVVATEDATLVDALQ